MNCNTCRYELSQCLDGRLPSGRRAVVMQHTASCQPCATFWEELQAAQRLTLQLPKERVSESFRDQLWERVRAGEGTPEAIFREPVPLLAKARYALTGAAAAAAILLVGLWWNDNQGGQPRRTEDVANTENVIAPVQPVPVQPVFEQQAEPSALSTFGTGSILNAATPFTTNVLAKETAHQIELRIDSVNHGLQRLTLRPGADTDLVDRIVDEANDLHDFAEILLDLRSRGRLSFSDPAVDGELQFVTSMVGRGRLQDTHDLQMVQTFIRPAVEDSRHLHDIGNQMLVLTTDDPREEATVLIHITTMRPEVFPKLFFVIGQVGEGHNDLGMPRQNVFLFEDFCGSSNYVAPRSRVQSQGRVQPRIR